MNKTVDINWDDNSLFEKIERDKSQLNVVVRPSLTYWQDAWIRLSKNKIALLCLGILILFILLSIVGPYMTPYDFKSNDPDATDLLPNLQHWFGTDSLGRDLWERIWMGGRVSLSIGFAVTIL
ncbi:MAG TPA: ABC transporter permease, partial [Patescibacteria group bacterium]|nr:ABC transporter permease [Patescibacteria group bacterium]